MFVAPRVRIVGAYDSPETVDVVRRQCERLCPCDDEVPVPPVWLQRIVDVSGIGDVSHGRLGTMPRLDDHLDLVVAEAKSFDTIQSVLLAVSKRNYGPVDHTARLLRDRNAALPRAVSAPLVPAEFVPGQPSTCYPRYSSNPRFESGKTEVGAISEIEYFHRILIPEIKGARHSPGCAASMVPQGMSRKAVLLTAVPFGSVAANAPTFRSGAHLLFLAHAPPPIGHGAVG